MSSQPPPPPSGPFGPPPSGPDQPGQPGRPGHQPAPPAFPPTAPPPPPPGTYPTYAPVPSAPGQGPGPFDQPAPPNVVGPTPRPPVPGGGFGGPPPGGPGSGGPGGPGGPGAPGGDGGKKRGALWAAIGVIVAIAVGVGIFLAVSGDDDGGETGGDTTLVEDTEPDDTEPVETDAPTTTEAATTTAPPTTIPATLPTLPPVTTAAPETTLAPDPNRVDLGHGVTFQLPEGYVDTPSDTGSSHQLDNGIVNAFFQVLERVPGESPLDLLQEYVNTFDDDFDSVVYSQVIPTEPAEGEAPADGNLVYYRALNADGTGVKGVIDANRRADGLAYVSDVFLAIDADTDNKFPEDALNAVYNSFLDAPLIDDPVELTPPTFTRVETIHAPVVIDGFVAVTPPAGWTVDVPGPGRVVMSRPDGQRFLGEKIPNVTDIDAGRFAATATVLSLVPDATFGTFNSTEATGEWSFVTARWGGTDPNTGQPLQGYISLWFDPASGEAYDSLEAWIGPSTDPPSVVESEFLFQALDTSITNPRG